MKINEELVRRLSYSDTTTKTQFLQHLSISELKKLLNIKNIIGDPILKETANIRLMYLKANKFYN